MNFTEISKFNLQTLRFILKQNIHTCLSTSAATPSIFGQANKTSASENVPAFGGASTIFGGNKPNETSTTNIFAAATTTSTQESKGVDFSSASKDLPTFSGLTSGSTGKDFYRTPSGDQF